MNKKVKQIKIDIREVVFSNEEGKSFCDIFIYEPENIDEQSLGSLYILGEVVNFPSNSSYLINLLASIAKKEFYSDSKKSTTESLEASLHKVNSTLSDMAEQGNIDWIGNLNMIFCAYKNEELHLSQAGEIKTMLIRDKQITDIGKNVISETNSHPIRTFANIASGELEIGDLVLFATPELFNVFSTEKLKQLSSSLDTEDLAGAVQDAIEKEKDVNTMGLFIMKVGEEKEEEFTHVEIKSQITTEKEEAVPMLQEEKTKKDENIFLTEKSENEKELVNEKRISLEDIIKEYEEDNKNDFENKKNPELKLEKIIEDREKIEFLEKNNLNEEQKSEETNKFLQALDEDQKTNLLNNISNKLKSLINKESLLHVIDKIKRIIFSLKKILERDDVNQDPTQELASLSKRKKLILATFILILIILTGGLLSEIKKKSDEENLQNYQNLIIKVEEKISQAEIESINSPSDARGYLLEAREIIKEKNSSLTGKTYQDLNNKTNSLINKIQNQLDILDLVEKIENPVITIDLSQFESTKNAEKIFENDKEYFILGQDNMMFSEISLAEKSVKNFDIGNIDHIKNLDISSNMKKTNEIIFLKNKNEIEILNSNKKTITSESINFIDNAFATKDIASYSNYLYFLSPESSQIYKYKRLTNGFDEGIQWLTGEVDIKDSVSIAIDGSIYLLNSDGSINKFRTGNQELFAIEIPSNPIPSTAKIYTNSNLKYLYVTDLENKRVLLFNKTTGNLVKQYTSEKFHNIKNIVIDSKEEKIYILNGNEIFEIEIKI
ncbi:MAG: hypothetical protein KAS01_02020 [Candidatus Pacebacteria bacterium]|nr:hypothetical protein [Candidatus Paceibacterota bacterium]